ncbi:hypothetical protein C8034_v008697 [Colletotrichum sidae]|uniref:Uncharacterized protein n=1 Tax=Colletotrichum sidae TaxID=1347389 RepID=A0A4R8T2F5_9PEZI|nr:hypothetical protein C8034_v008697 [Colletotrichum sidae]
MESQLRPRENRPLMEESGNTSATAPRTKTQGVAEPLVRETRSNDTAYEPVPDTTHSDAQHKFRRANTDPFVIIADILGVIWPIGFIVFAGLVIQLNDKETDESSAGQWRNAVTILATLFPILFAAVVGRLMSQIARWRLEHGAKMGMLEQLMGSRTVGGTILVHFQLRALNLLALFLLLIWVFSPLGGQSILRMLTTRSNKISRPSDVVYFDTDAPSQFAAWSESSPTSYAFNINRMSIVDAMYSALILSPDAVKSDSMDVWGNVKIPALSSYGSLDDPEWQTVPSSPNDVEFSSLVGVPVTRVSEGNTTFYLESSYADLACTNLTTDAFATNGSTSSSRFHFATAVVFNESPLCMSDRCGAAAPNGTWQGWNLNGTMLRNFTLANPDPQAGWNLALDTFVNTSLWGDLAWAQGHGIPYGRFNSPGSLVNETNIDARPTTLLFQARQQTDARAPPDYVTSRCSVTQHHVESRVRCSRAAAAPGGESSSARQTCRVLAQRPSRKPHASERVSQLSFPRVFRYVSRKLPLATNHHGTSYTADISLNYLDDPSSAVMTAAASQPELARVPARVFGFRLARLVNSYVFLSQAFDSAPSGSVDAQAVFETNVTAGVDVETGVEVWKVETVWVGLYILSCAVFLVGALTSAVVAHFVHGPDVLGYVSSNVRDSKFMEIPAGAGRMDGIMLTKMLKDKKVRYGYTQAASENTPLVGVGPKEEVAKIRGKKQVA